MKNSAIIPVTGAVICAIVAIAFVRTGVARVGDRTGSNGLEISRAKNPVLFWSLVALVLILGAYLAAVGIGELWTGS